MTADDAGTAKLAEWEALVGAVTRLPRDVIPGPFQPVTGWVHTVPPERLADMRTVLTTMPALLGFVREVRVALAHEACADTCGSQLNEVYPCSCWKSTIERALTERIGGEG